VKLVRVREAKIAQLERAVSPREADHSAKVEAFNKHLTDLQKL
jgi:hypothetical protein